MRPMLIGQAPARSGDGRPFTGASGNRLIRLLGLNSYRDLSSIFVMTNLLPDAVPKQGKGDAFDLKAAADRAERIRRNLPDGARVFCAGRLVWKAFDLPRNAEYLRVYFSNGPHGQVRFLLLPHPSGVNRWWNDPEHVKAAETFLKLWVFEAL